MSRYSFWSLVVILIFVFSACKTEFEKVRSSGDPELMSKAADKYFKDENYVQAQSLYEIIIPYYRGKEEAAKIFFNYAYTHYHLDEFILASHYFQNFANTYLNSDNREEALYMAAYSHYELSPGAELDQSYSQEAINEFQTFINTYPNSSKVKKANALIQEMRAKQEVKAYKQGQLYLDVKQYEAAMVSFENMVQEFPDSELAEKARYKSAIASYDLAKNSIYSKQFERYQDTVDRIEKFLKKYPRSEFKKELIRLKTNSLDKIKEL